MRTSNPRVAGSNPAGRALENAILQVIYGDEQKVLKSVEPVYCNRTATLYDLRFEGG
jgi:hypothetical protein